jgi:hypothetical protein
MLRDHILSLSSLVSFKHSTLRNPSKSFHLRLATVRRQGVRRVGLPLPEQNLVRAEGVEPSQAF